MTWKEKRIVTVLSVILAVLAAALLIVLSLRYREHREQNQTMVTPQGEVVSAQEYTQLNYFNSVAAPSFSCNGDKGWSWADEPDFPLDSAVLEEILALVLEPQPQQTLAMEGGPEAFGLDKPRSGVTVQQGDGASRTVIFGNATTDGKSYYAMLDGDETTAYILPGRLYDLLQTPVYSMMRLPSLPSLTEEKLSSLTIQGPQPQEGEASVLFLRARAEEPAGWQSGTENVTDKPAVQDLVQDVVNLQLGRCVDYKPTESAVEICGLTNPVVLTIGYLMEGGAEQELQLLVGGPVADGTGRYTQLGNSSTIYFVSGEQLDSLLALSAGGLN